MIRVKLIIIFPQTKLHDYQMKDIFKQKRESVGHSDIASREGIVCHHLNLMISPSHSCPVLSCKRYEKRILWKSICMYTLFSLVSLLRHHDSELPICLNFNAVVEGIDNALGIQSPFCVRPVTQCLGSKIPIKRTSILTPKKVLHVESVELSPEEAKVADILKIIIDEHLEHRKDFLLDQVNLKVSPVREASEGLESQQSSVDSARTFRSRTSGTSTSILQSYKPRSKATPALSSHDKKSKDSYSDGEGFSPGNFSATRLDFTSDELKRENKLTDARYNFKFLTYERPASEVQLATATDTVQHPNMSVLEVNKSVTTAHQASSITWTSFSSPLSAAVPVSASTYPCTPIFRDSDPEESTTFSPGIIPFSPDPKSSRNEEPQEMSCTIFSPLYPFSPASTVITADPSLAQNDDASVLVQNENLLQDFYPSEISFFCGEVSESAKKRLEEKTLESPSKLHTRLYRIDEKLFRENENSEYENISDLQKSVISQKGHQNGEKELFGNFEEDFDAELSMLWESATDDLLSETHSERDEDEASCEIETTGMKKTISYVFSRFILAIILTFLVYLTASISVKICSLPTQQSRFTNFDHREFLLMREDFLFHDQTTIPESYFSSFPDLFITQDFSLQETSLEDVSAFIVPADDGADIDMWDGFHSISDENEGSGSHGNPEIENENENFEIEVEKYLKTMDSLKDINADFEPSITTQTGESEILSERDGDDTLTWSEDITAEISVAPMYSESAPIDLETDLTKIGNWVEVEDTNNVILSEPEYVENTADSVPSESNGEMDVEAEMPSLLAEEKEEVQMHSISSSSSTEVSVFLSDSNANAGSEREESEKGEEEGEGEGEIIILEVKESEGSTEDISDPVPTESLITIVDESVAEPEPESESVEHTTTEDPSKDEDPLYSENPLKLQDTIVMSEMSEVKEETVLKHENVQISVSSSHVQEDLSIAESEREKIIPQQMGQKSPSSPRFAVTPHGLFIGAGIFSIFSFFVILYFVVGDVKRRSVLKESNFESVRRETFTPEVQYVPKNVPQDAVIAGVEVVVDIGIGMATVQFEEKEREIKRERKLKDRSSLLPSVRVTRNATKNCPELLLEEPSSIRRMSTRQRK
jgi:hypothetical protein